MDYRKGVKYTKQSNRKFKEKLIERTDSQGNVYFWLGGSPVEGEEIENSDIKAINENYISITPVKLDLYDVELEELLLKDGKNYETN